MDLRKLSLVKLYVPNLFDRVFDDLFPEVPIDESSAAKLCYISRLIVPSLSECLLMMIIPLSLMIIDCPNITDDVEPVKDIFLASSNNY